MNKSIHTVIQFLFILLSIAIPTSIAITNLLIAAIILFWFLDGRFKNKIKEFTLLKWPNYLFFLVFFYMLGLLWGDNHNKDASSIINPFLYPRYNPYANGINII